MRVWLPKCTNQPPANQRLKDPPHHSAAARMCSSAAGCTGAARSTVGAAAFGACIRGFGARKRRGLMVAEKAGCRRFMVRGDPLVMLVVSEFVAQKVFGTREACVRVHHFGFILLAGTDLGESTSSKRRVRQVVCRFDDESGRVSWDRGAGQ